MHLLADDPFIFLFVYQLSTKFIQWMNDSSELQASIPSFPKRVPVAGLFHVRSLPGVRSELFAVITQKHFQPITAQNWATLDNDFHMSAQFLLNH